ncbi:Pyridoxal-phosphate dependent enzyme [Schinkia azotoformans MEV2011]|uniref:Pyridoxal-phosphate dependent enzyme n=1 Tax=Schinkia azotoformans MEV2011 TaxID=1348973 RepID=A0A072NU81_SCHAZ|nr:pyridoxal-phosphate dependent enzyme [Schinkia azotoformans]KEF36800.1 Pyridoxal-phosphate dependent enzyme [Schinkia azotoformans MEV2011]MEC1698182.1 pyridoxal-phosphate dependent enzyme [Schinkia azotoformans]MEC1725225.1 pyridoxal-phosphate dependent enzyme [Schinkia azotoformans]MEC1773838.1 pyridoxal-phosphate dependent enzyme [Schinkia azotoformans]MEC1777945.1 pyridoxal-phosphate dependent enzyme [Schinkia azotoformans]
MGKRVKDESYRFGLNAFKVLGGSYAVGKYLAEKLNVDISELSFEKLRSKEVKEKLGSITFVTATDGNHGRGIAWATNQLGQKSVVYIPKGSSEIRLNNIRKEGSEASITDLNYDDTIVEVPALRHF